VFKPGNRKLVLHTEMQRYETLASLAHFLSDRSPKRERLFEGEMS
jgi:hypothetical protein